MVSEMERVSAQGARNSHTLGDRVVNGAALMAATSLALRLLQLFTTTVWWPWR
jgi:hypothetical protein